MTTTTTTTVVILATIKAAVAFALIGTLVLILALVIREMTRSYEEPKPTVMERLKALSRNVIMVIIPLASFFVMTLTLTICSILGW